MTRGFLNRARTRWVCSGRTRHARQDRQLPDCGDRGSVDGGARVAARCGVVPAAGVVHRRASATGAHPGACAVSGEMAAGADACRSRAARRHRRRVGDGGRRLRRYSRISHGIGAAPAAIHARHLRAIRRLDRATAGRPRAVDAWRHRREHWRHEVATWAAQQPARVWRRVTWRNGPRRAWRARFLAVRVTPVVLWRQHRPLRTGWLLCERPLGRAAGPLKWYISNLPPTTRLRTLVRAAHQRWAIEQQYQQLKEELGLNHFEGRSYPGWQRHVVLTALAYTGSSTNDDAGCRAAPRCRSCAP